MFLTFRAVFFALSVRFHAFFIAVCRLSCCKRYRFASQNMAFYAPNMSFCKPKSLVLAVVL